LADGRQAVVKVRPYEDRLYGCADAQRALWMAGFPSPEPLVGPVPYGDGRAANAEVLVAGGGMLGVDGVDACAGLLATQIRLAPTPGTIRSLAPNTVWTEADHAFPGLWPPPDDRDADLNAHPEPWLDDAACRVRHRIRRLRGAPRVVAHGDWEAHNLRWVDGHPLAVHDWDSVIAVPEPVAVGLAAAVWPTGAVDRAATVDESAAFVEAYQRAAGRRWTADEAGASWAAGLWVYAYNTKKVALDGVAWLTPGEADQRLRLAGA
jgi:hypothetical protein